MTKVKTKTNYSFHHTLPHHINTEANFDYSSTIFNFMKVETGYVHERQECHETSKDKSVVRHRKTRVS